MSASSFSAETAQCYEPPRNIQFSVFLDNRVGKLLDLAEVFQGQYLTVAGLSVVDSTDHAVVRLLTSRSELARRLLARQHLPCSEAEVLVVELGEGKTLTSLCHTLLTAELNIHYAYPLLVHPRGLPALVLYTDDLLLSAHVLRRKLFTLLAENDLGGNASRGTPGDPTFPPLS